MPAVPSSVIEPLWDQFQVLIPPVVDTHPLGCHKPRIADRVVFDKLVQVLVYGAAYVKIADASCSATTIRSRRDEWITAGIFAQMEQIALKAYDRIVGLDLGQITVDGCLVKAPCGGEVSGRSPVDRGKLGTKRSIMTDGSGIPIGCVIAPANRHDSPLLRPTLEHLGRFETRLGVGLPDQITVHLDAGYDSAKTRALLAELGCHGVIRLWTLAPLRGLDPTDGWNTVADLPPETLQRMGVEGVPLRKFRRTMRDIPRWSATDPRRLEAEMLWGPAITQLMQTANDAFDEADAPELGLALDAGAITLVSDGTAFEDDVDDQILWFRDRIAEALADPGSTVLVDQLTSQFLREEFFDGGDLPTIPNSRSRRSATGAGLVERLPTFPDAPMAAVLEARDELTEGRSKYRTAVKALADKLESTALDETLPSEIDELWHDDVRPQLDNLRKTVKASRLGQETGKRLIAEGFGVPSLLVAIAGMADLAGALPTPITVAGAAGRIAAAGASEAFQARSARKKHDLVYLLDLNRYLGDYGLG